MPVRWTFRYYARQNGKDDVRDAYDRGSKQLHARFLSRVKALAQLPVGEWGELAKQLHGSCSGLVEIRFKADNVQQRPLGYRSGETEFTILFWATERGNRFVPASACEKALERKKKIIDREASTNALWLVLE